MICLNTEPQSLDRTNSPLESIRNKTKLFPLSKKAETSNPQLTQEIFMKLMENESMDRLLNTDDSCCELANISSCAFYKPKLGERKARVLSEYTTSFNAELATINQALQQIYPLDWPDITIFTDSKSAIQAISSLKWESSSLITEILSIITNQKSAVTQLNHLRMDP